MRPSPALARTTRAAFTLVELLVVLVIITIVISLVIPAVGKVRRKARLVVSQQLATQVVNAASTFQQDKRRLPGYYSAREMGLKNNGDKTGAGMPAMLNALLDLAGGVVSTGAFASDDPDAIRVAPFPATGNKTAGMAWVNPSLIGAAGAGNKTAKGYIALDKKYFYSPRPNAGANITRAGNLSVAIPDLNDAFGTPMLLWSADETMTDTIAFDNGTGGAGAGLHNNFVRENSDENKNHPGPAMFYWASNGCYLNATSLGRARTDQTKAGGTRDSSLIGGGNGELWNEQALTTILGNPGLPRGDQTLGANYILPAAPRGKFVVQCANPDGYYYQAKDKTASGSLPLQYGHNYFLNDGTTLRKDAAGKPTNVDVTQAFNEDILAVGGS